MHERYEYQRAYYLANKERLKEKRKEKRKAQPRTPAQIAAEERYREKKRLLKEIEAMPTGPWWKSAENE